MEILYTIATWLIPLTFAIVFHEVAHGWVARACGDPTASRMGRLTLNPIKHVDPVGTVVLPMFLAVMSAPIFGWAKPVPVVPARMRNPRWHMVLVALAGPGSNILLALLTLLAMAGLWVNAGPPDGAGYEFLWANLTNFTIINIMLALFNMLPLPPFDGSHVVEGVLPRPLAAGYARLRPYGLALMVILFVAVPLLFPQTNLAARLLGPPVEIVLGWANNFLAALV
jgi:Zn-dependent protease